jgi:hypothetical protein
MERLKFLGKGVAGIKESSKPLCGTRFLSKPLSVPTIKTSAKLFKFLMALAQAIAGSM